jgi:hypothetical protein
MLAYVQSLYGALREIVTVQVDFRGVACHLITARRSQAPAQVAISSAVLGPGFDTSQLAAAAVSAWRRARVGMRRWVLDCSSRLSSLPGRRWTAGSPSAPCGQPSCLLRAHRSAWFFLTSWRRGRRCRLSPPDEMFTVATEPTQTAPSRLAPRRTRAAPRARCSSVISRTLAQKGPSKYTAEATDIRLPAHPDRRPPVLRDPLPVHRRQIRPPASSMPLVVLTEGEPWMLVAA